MTVVFGFFSLVVSKRREKLHGFAVLTYHIS